MGQPTASRSRSRGRSRSSLKEDHFELQVENELFGVFRTRALGSWRLPGLQTWLRAQLQLELKSFIAMHRVDSFWKPLGATTRFENLQEKRIRWSWQTDWVRSRDPAPVDEGFQPHVFWTKLPEDQFLQLPTWDIMAANLKSAIKRACRNTSRYPRLLYLDDVHEALRTMAHSDPDSVSADMSFELISMKVDQPVVFALFLRKGHHFRIASAAISESRCQSDRRMHHGGARAGEPLHGARRFWDVPRVCVMRGCESRSRVCVLFVVGQEV